MQRKALLKKKEKQIQAQLERWAKRSLRLQPGEHIVFTLSLAKSPIVVRGADALLEMKTADYFTKERFRAAGIPLSRLTTRIRNLACTVVAIMESKEKGKGISLRDESFLPFGTVGSMVSLGRQKLLRWDNLGPKSVDVIEKVLRHDGIILPE